MPVRGKTLTTMLLESIDDRSAPSAAAKDDSGNFAAELGAVIVTGETDFGALPPLRPAFKEASASSSKRRAARTGSARLPEKNTLDQAALAPVLVPVAASNSSPDLSQTDTDSSVANGARAIPQKATASSIVIPDAQAQAGASILTIARAQSTESSITEGSETSPGESDAAGRNQKASAKPAPDSLAASRAGTDSTQSPQSGKSPSAAHTTASTDPNPAREQQPERDQQPGDSPAESPSGVAQKIKSSSEGNSSQQTATVQPNDAPLRQAGQAVTPATKPALQKDQPGQAEPDATAATNLASATGAHSVLTQSQAGDTRAVTAAPMAAVTAITRAPETATLRVANLKVDLNDAGSAHATIRERAGEVDVKIVTPDSDSARHLVGEVNALRRSLDGAGLRLRSAEVVYRSDRYQNPQRDDSPRNSRQSSAGSTDTFTIEETNQ